jgi:hypothetical protein
MVAPESIDIVFPGHERELALGHKVIRWAAATTHF